MKQPWKQPAGRHTYSCTKFSTSNAHDDSDDLVDRRPVLSWKAAAARQLVSVIATWVTTTATSTRRVPCSMTRAFITAARQFFFVFFFRLETDKNCNEHRWPDHVLLLSLPSFEQAAACCIDFRPRCVCSLQFSARRCAGMRNIWIRKSRTRICTTSRMRS